MSLCTEGEVGDFRLSKLTLMAGWDDGRRCRCCADSSCSLIRIDRRGVCSSTDPPRDDDDLAVDDRRLLLDSPSSDSEVDDEMNESRDDVLRFRFARILSFPCCRRSNFRIGAMSEYRPSS